jgi:hypothetical protein
MVPEKRHGFCFVIALMEIINGRAGVLVHGNHADHVDGLHAWIENGGEAWDPVSNQSTPMSEYLGKAEARYDRVQAISAAIKHGNCGPWHNSIAASNGLYGDVAGAVQRPLEVRPSGPRPCG